jgi:hypothetical protein
MCRELFASVKCTKYVHFLTQNLMIIWIKASLFLLDFSLTKLLVILNKSKIFLIINLRRSLIS